MKHTTKSAFYFGNQILCALTPEKRGQSTCFEKTKALLHPRACLELPGVENENAIYHIMARNDRREPIVTDDVDREMLVKTLGQLCEKTGWEVFASALMDNHCDHAVRAISSKG